LRREKNNINGKRMKTIKVLNILTIVFAGLMLNSCEALFSCLEGNGVGSTEERGVSNFTGIYSTSDFDVEVIQSNETRIVVQADENLQQYIKTYVEAGDLFLETDNYRCLDSETRMQITIYCPFLETVVLSGSGDMEVSGFNPEYFTVTLSGSGDIDFNNILVGKSIEVNIPGSGDIMLDGKSPQAYYYLSGSGDIDGSAMTTDYSKVVLSGSGDVEVFAYEELDVILSGSGNIYVYGGPVIQDRITGSGKIILR
jgi:hypothetical protein